MQPEKVCFVGCVKRHYTPKCKWKRRCGRHDGNNPSRGPTKSLERPPTSLCADAERPWRSASGCVARQCRAQKSRGPGPCGRRARERARALAHSCREARFCRWIFIATEPTRGGKTTAMEPGQTQRLQSGQMSSNEPITLRTGPWLHAKLERGRSGELAVGPSVPVVQGPRRRLANRDQVIGHQRGKARSSQSEPIIPARDAPSQHGKPRPATCLQHWTLATSQCKPPNCFSHLTYCNLIFLSNLDFLTRVTHHTAHYCPLVPWNPRRMPRGCGSGSGTGRVPSGHPLRQRKHRQTRQKEMSQEVQNLRRFTRKSRPPRLAMSSVCYSSFASSTRSACALSSNPTNISKLWSPHGASRLGSRAAPG